MNKQLLLKDLCARFPYGLICALRPITNIRYYDMPLNGELLDDLNKKEWGDVKPYLRPISSMTKEEQKEFVKFHCLKICPIVSTDFLTIENETEMIDWLNKKMFDYRGLIEKGLALEAPEGMYNFNKE